MCVNYAYNLTFSIVLEGVRWKEVKQKLEERYVQISCDLWLMNEVVRVVQLQMRRVQVQQMSLQVLVDEGMVRGDGKFVVQCVKNVDVRQIVLYLLWFRNVSEDMFYLVVVQVKFFGCLMYVYVWREDFRYLDERGVFGFYMGLGVGFYMDRVYVK